MSQSPSLRGSGRFQCQPTSKQLRSFVSIPFIAGQWSLRCAAALGLFSSSLCFNPLHCGAVVASIVLLVPIIIRCSVSIPFIAGQWSLQTFYGLLEWLLETRFNPLHCGAVVASLYPGAVKSFTTKVSIPFIAGQWSLLAGAASLGAALIEFQSPSLRGSGRFRARRTGAPTDPDVSIPFIAGQWSLPWEVRSAPDKKPKFQSPSLRGSGRFRSAAWFAAEAATFQSPSLRGSGRFPPPPATATTQASRFNPLHCGAVVASGFGRL